MTSKPSKEARKSFVQLTPRQKAVFLAQVVICVCTLGFVFPNVFG